MNSPVTSLHVPFMTIPNKMIIYQPWLKKMPSELGKAAQKDFIVKICISKANLSFEDDVIGRKQLHVSNHYFAFEKFDWFYCNYFGKRQTRDS